MPEGQEMTGSSIAVLEKPIPLINHTPLKNPPPAPGHNEVSNEPPNPENLFDAKRAFEEFKARARTVTEMTKDRKWNELSSSEQEEVRAINRGPRSVFETYYKNAVLNNNLTEIIQFYNPDLTPDEIVHAQQYLREYAAAKKEIPGSHSPEYKERAAKYQPIRDELATKLRELKLDRFLDSFPENKFVDSIDKLVAAELHNLGMPFALTEFEAKVRVLNTLRAYEKTDLYKHFFTEGVADKLQKEIYEESMRICFEQRNIEDFSDNAHWKEITRIEEPGKAIEFLTQYPTPEFVRRLIVINSLDKRMSYNWRGKQSEYYEGHARRALLKMKEGANWHEIVNDTIDKYPELESVRSELLELRVSEMGSYSQKSEMLYDLRYAVEQRILVPMQLGMSDYPNDDPLLTDYLKTRRVRISVKRLYENLISSQALDEFDGKEMGALPFDLVQRTEHDIDSGLNGLNKPDLTVEQRDQLLTRYKRMLVLGKALKGTNLIEDRYKPSKTASELCVKLLDSQLTDEQLSIATQLIADAKLPIDIFLKGDRILYERVLRASKVDVVLAQEGLLPPKGKNRSFPRNLHALGEYFIDSSLSEEQITTVAHLIAEFDKEAELRHAYLPRLIDRRKEPKVLVDFFNALVVFEPDAVDSLVLKDWTALFGSEGITKFATFNPIGFITQSSKQDWKDLIGEEVMTTFLRALPEESDERRNAFLHNDYDRTTDFMKFLVGDRQLPLTRETVQMAGEYIELFGFSRSKTILNYFDQLTQYENGRISELPSSMIELGLTNKAEFIKSILRMKDKMYGEAPLLDLSDLSKFELDLLNVLTGKASHRFDLGRPSFEVIVSDFQKDVEDGLVDGIPEGYTQINLNSADVKLHLDVAPYESTVREIVQEIQQGINFEQEAGSLRLQAASLLQKKIDALKALTETPDDERKDILKAEMVKFQSYFDLINEIPAEELTSDVLFRHLISIKAGKTDRAELGKLIQATIFARLYETESGFHDLMNEFAKWGIDSTTVAPEQLLKLKDFIKDPLKEHVLKFGSEEEMMKYWSPETRKAIKDNRDNMRDIFEPYFGKLSEGVSAITSTTNASGIQIHAIPDRGFIGEMSGYLADVCYTAEYPLLSGRKVVPYKFVRKAASGGSSEFIGSVLVFEVATDSGEDALLVRGFDIPHEESFDIGNLIETFIDGLSEVAKKRGKTKILVPGNSGAVSNYSRTIHHMFKSYSKDQERRVGLSERFDFNRYDLSQNCFIARDLGSVSANYTPLISHTT